MRRKAILGIPMLLLATSWGLTAQPAGAVTERPLAQVSILPIARPTDGGAAITVKVRISCQPNGINGIQWEGFIDATQGDVFAWAGLPLVCDGRQHVEDVVLPVSAPPGTAFFTRGDATVRAVVQDENTLTTYASDARTVKVR